MNENNVIPSTFNVKEAKTLNIVSRVIDMVSGAWACLPRSRRSEKKPQSCANPTVARAMKGHSEPIGRFLPPHLLDSLNDGAKIVSAAHGRKGAEDECHRESVVFQQRPGLIVTGNSPRREDAVGGQARLLETAHDPAFDEFEVTAAQARDTRGLPQVGSGRGRQLPDFQLRIARTVVSGAQFVTRQRR
jgi:hypothetical protein